MNDVLKTVFDANLATLLIVASLGFLFIAVAGSVAGKIDPGKAGRIGAAVTGAVLLVLGIALKVSTSEPRPGAAAELAVPSGAAVAADDTSRAEPEPHPEPEIPPAEAVRVPVLPDAQQAQILEEARQRIEDARRPGARFFGTLFSTDGSERRPLGGAQVELRVPGASAASYSTLAAGDGVYAFPSVAPGTYEIRVQQGETPLTVIAPPRPVTIPERAGARRLAITVRR